MSYVYDEDGTLIAQTLTGGAQSSWGQSARYVYLPTASGPMPVAAIYGTKHYAIQSDHLNTPRRLIQSDGQVAWQWAYSAFGEEKPTTAKTRFANADLNQSFGTTTVPAVTFNLRYPGQYYDQESNLHYNLNRSYDSARGRYTQADPIGLQGGWNRYSYAEQNPMSFTDPLGLTTGKGLIWLVKICKSGIQKIRPVSPEEAVRLAKQGKDLESSRSAAKKIANAASGGKKPTKDPIHPDKSTGSTEGRKPHYHPNPRSGSHIFYNVATSLTLAGQVDCDDCTLGYIAEGLDFFNPLSLPKDIMDLTGIGVPD